VCHIFDEARLFSKRFDLMSVCTWYRKSATFKVRPTPSINSVHLRNNHGVSYSNL